MQKKLILIGSIVFVLAALIVTTLLIKQNQDNRQRASGDSLSSIISSGTRDGIKSWASTKTIAQINDAVAALSQADRDTLSNLVIDTNVTGSDKDKLLVAVKQILNNRSTGFYSEIFSYTNLNIVSGTGGGNATCNTATLSIKEADAATFLDTLFHESLHSFNCVNGGPDGALNEGSAIWIFKVAFPEGRNPDELLSGFAETVYGTVNYYRDYGVGGSHTISLSALGSTSAKSHELFTWLSSVDGSHLPYSDQTKLQYCYDTYYKNVPRTDADWFAKAKSASQSMIADPQCYTPGPSITTSPTPSGPTLDQEEWNFVRILNEHRQSMGRGALRVSVKLTTAATWMSEDMAANNRFDHTDSLGRGLQARLTFFGYGSNAGENIASTGPTGQNAFDAWLASTQGHKEEMENVSRVAVGISRVLNPSSGWLWTADFGSTLDVEITQTPTPSITESPTPTETITPTVATSPTITSTITPTVVTLPTNTPTPTNVPTPTPTRTPTPTPTNTPTPSPTPTTPITPTPTVIVITQQPSPTPTNTPSPSPTPTVVIATATNTPTATPPAGGSPTATPTIAKPGGMFQTFGVIGGIFIVILAGIFLLAL